MKDMWKVVVFEDRSGLGCIRTPLDMMYKEFSDYPCEISNLFHKIVLI